MIRTMVLTKEDRLILDEPIHEILVRRDLKWYWIDFSKPTIEERDSLHSFGFHPLAVEDCLHVNQRPKVDYYHNYQFYVINGLYHKTLKSHEIGAFLSPTMLVTYHALAHVEMDEIWGYLSSNQEAPSKDPKWILYKIIDKMVDASFPHLENIEEQLNRLESKSSRSYQIQTLMDELFVIRRKLSHIRHFAIPMRELVDRMIHSEKQNHNDEERRHYQDVHDHLVKLAGMIEASREITSDIRDNYLSVNSNRMNTVMMTLTVITTIFMPLTFIAGIYGMNFHNMPELKWQYGYFIVLGVMAILGFTMYLLFKKKGWFDE
ncbi:magnesium/cobalt transporter CorA [Thermoactinomyces sp. DSM 45892]|uniref:magnesium/cobalt transporter CorA n=1 Tax=Thermoactinomyces sp. DSM 45892 TaxID=1882753 RepID=UPI000897C2BE|nr:magnesium/cobalt transporter CorA [Thermoactinomyces sp. DSM 45892]SDZ20493.1 magnesium transporter [Thermoactinomyces sp. DSM 45892]